MDRPTIPLRRDVFERWCKLQTCLGIADMSDFADHLMEEYKRSHNHISEVVSASGVEREKSTNINGVTVKREMVDGESCDSADTSGKASPDLDYLQSKDKQSSRKRKQRSFLGLESVVQRLHQAKVGGSDDARTNSKDDRGVMQEDDPPATAASPSSGWTSKGDAEDVLPPPVKQERLSLEEYTYTSPKIVPESARSLDTDTPGRQADPPSSLRKLLERPAVNASVELRRNAAELKERGVVINPAMYGRGSPPPYEAHHQLAREEPPAAQALDSLIRMALQAKGEGGVPTEAELLKAVHSHGEALGEAQASSFQVSHVPRGTCNSAPALKSILQRGGGASYVPSGLSAREGQLGDCGKPGAYSMPSAAFALQHLAKMRGPENVPVDMRTIVTEEVVPAETPRPKRTYTKRQKQGGKLRRKHKSGSKKKNGSNPPTVKSLLDKKDASPSKYRGRTHGAKGTQRGKGRKRSKEGNSATGKRGRKKMKASKGSPGKARASAEVRSASPPPTLIDITHSAAHVVQIMSGHEAVLPTSSAPPCSMAVSMSVSDPLPSERPAGAAVSVAPQPAMDAPSPITNTAPSPFVGVKTHSRSPGLNHSASEVMKLLASQNLSARPTVVTSVGQPDPLHSSPLRQIAATPPKAIGEKPYGGIAGIMKQLATNYSQGAARNTMYPNPGAMFFSPSAGDSSSAFSLMKELITKGSS